MGTGMSAIMVRAVGRRAAFLSVAAHPPVTIKIIPLRHATYNPAAVIRVVVIVNSPDNSPSGGSTFLDFGAIVKLFQPRIYHLR